MYTKVKYSVTSGMNGLYLPDSVSYATTLAGAYDFAKFLKDSWLDSGDIVKGNIRVDRAYYIFRTGKTYPDFLIEIHDLAHENLLMDDDGRISDDDGKTWHCCE